MTKLEAVIERLKALPEDRREYLAHVFEEVLDDEDADLRVSDEDYAEAERRIAVDEPLIPHDEVFASLYKKLGK